MFLLYEKWSPWYSIAIRQRLRQFCATRRHLRSSHANSRRIRHSCVIRLSLRSYAHYLPHWVLLTSINLFIMSSAKKIRSTCPKANFTSDPNDFTPQSNDFTPDSNNPFCNPGLGMINLLGCRAINPKSHIPWKGKAKRVVKHVKG